MPTNQRMKINLNELKERAVHTVTAAVAVLVVATGVAAGVIDLTCNIERKEVLLSRCVVIKKKNGRMLKHMTTLTTSQHIVRTSTIATADEIHSEYSHHEELYTASVNNMSLKKSRNRTISNN